MDLIVAKYHPKSLLWLLYVLTINIPTQLFTIMWADASFMAWILGIGMWSAEMLKDW